MPDDSLDLADDDVSLVDGRRLRNLFVLAALFAATFVAFGFVRMCG